MSCEPKAQKIPDCPKCHGAREYEEPCWCQEPDDYHWVVRDYISRRGYDGEGPECPDCGGRGVIYHDYCQECEDFYE